MMGGAIVAVVVMGGAVALSLWVDYGRPARHDRDVAGGGETTASAGTPRAGVLHR